MARYTNVKQKILAGRSGIATPNSIIENTDVISPRSNNKELSAEQLRILGNVISNTQKDIARIEQNISYQQGKKQSSYRQEKIRMLIAERERLYNELQFQKETYKSNYDAALKVAPRDYNLSRGVGSREQLKEDRVSQALISNKKISSASNVNLRFGEKQYTGNITNNLYTGIRKVSEEKNIINKQIKETKPNRIINTNKGTSLVLQGNVNTAADVFRKLGYNKPETKSIRLQTVSTIGDRKQETVLISKTEKKITVSTPQEAKLLGVTSLGSYTKTTYNVDPEKKISSLIPENVQLASFPKDTRTKSQKNVDSIVYTVEKNSPIFVLPRTKKFLGYGSGLVLEGTSTVLSGVEGVSGTISGSFEKKYTESLKDPEFKSSAPVFKYGSFGFGVIEGAAETLRKQPGRFVVSGFVGGAFTVTSNVLKAGMVSGVPGLSGASAISSRSLTVVGGTLGVLYAKQVITDVDAQKSFRRKGNVLGGYSTELAGFSYGSRLGDVVSSPVIDAAPKLGKAYKGFVDRNTIYVSGVTSSNGVIETIRLSPFERLIPIRPVLSRGLSKVENFIAPTEVSIVASGFFPGGKRPTKATARSRRAPGRQAKRGRVTYTSDVKGISLRFRNPTLKKDFIKEASFRIENQGTSLNLKGFRTGEKADFSTGSIKRKSGIDAARSKTQGLPKAFRFSSSDVLVLSPKTDFGFLRSSNVVNKNLGISNSITQRLRLEKPLNAQKQPQNALILSTSSLRPRSMETSNKGLGDVFKNPSLSQKPQKPNKNKFIEETAEQNVPLYYSQLRGFENLRPGSPQARRVQALEKLRSLQRQRQEQIKQQLPVRNGKRDVFKQPRENIIFTEGQKLSRSSRPSFSSRTRLGSETKFLTGKVESPIELIKPVQRNRIVLRSRTLPFLGIKQDSSSSLRVRQNYALQQKTDLRQEQTTSFSFPFDNNKKINFNTPEKPRPKYGVSYSFVPFITGFKPFKDFTPDFTPEKPVPKTPVAGFGFPGIQPFNTYGSDAFNSRSRSKYSRGLRAIEGIPDFTGLQKVRRTPKRGFLGIEVRY